MNKTERSRLAAGIIFILVGAAFLAAQLMPGLFSTISIIFGWPWIIIGVGAALFIFGLAIGVPEMAVPACITAGIGCLLYWQNLTGNWGSWAYAWTLIPGFVGIGTVVSALIGGKRSEISDGLRTILVSLVLFIFFGSFLGAFTFLGAYWPLLIVAAGVILLLQGLIRGRGK